MRGIGRGGYRASSVFADRMRLRFCSLPILLLASSTPALAQAVGSCELGEAVGTLETVFLQSRVFNTGALFFGGEYTSGDGYLVPRVEGHSPVFAAGFWLGGTVGGELRVAAARYGNYTFWPGPLEDAETPPADCSEHDRIYEVTRQDVARYLSTGELTDDLRDWPHLLGAPVVDGDGVADNYDLAAGDRPEILGDANVWWVMNDAGNAHPARDSTPPMGVEVRVLGFLFDDARDRDLSRTSFYRYEIVNRGDRPIDSLYASIFTDPDLGDAGDDYIGSDTLRNLAFVYNDGPEDAVYGVPPAWGIQVLEGPVGLANGRDDDRDGAVDEAGERLRLTGASTFIGAGPQGTADPGAASEYYNFMRGTWGDGTPITASGQGYQTDGPVTTFFYLGDPVTESFWSELNTDGFGADSPPGDRRLVGSTGPFELAPGASATLHYAMPFAQGRGYLRSVARLRDVADTLAARHRAGAFAYRPVLASEWEGAVPLDPVVPIALSRVRPNPARGAARALLTLPSETRVRATLHDALGRQLAVVADAVLPRGESELLIPDGLAAGTYLLRVRVAADGEKTLTLTVAR